MVGEYGPWVPVALEPLFPCWSVLGHYTSEFQTGTGETQEKHEYVSCHSDMTEIIWNAR